MRLWRHLYPCGTPGYKLSSPRVREGTSHADFGPSLPYRRRRGTRGKEIWKALGWECFASWHGRAGKLMARSDVDDQIAGLGRPPPTPGVMSCPTRGPGQPNLGPDDGLLPSLH